ncbi:carbon-nitrogen hydrolase family protein [Thalassotalea maritima]|uniref:carbon-nitrogen hydrolase family protein n=1 Tax=Thalassotalea maritima TaxID=3242416 RepID=UPI003529942B
MVRVAAAQYAVTNDVVANLKNSVRMIEKAGKCEPDLIVLPEFANHNSWYDNAEHCYQVAIDLEGDFAQQIAQAAQRVSAYVVINCTVRRDGGDVTGTSLLFTPDGQMIGENDKQVLIGHENDFLVKARKPGPIIETPIGRLAMYSCMDGVINETPRGLALRGAQILCNSLNSFALDEGSLHIPVRAAENKVFVVAANKVGPLIPQDMLEAVAEGINIPVEFLSGAGESQIVAPNGDVLAKAGQGEQVIWADIDPSLADIKLRPDGTHIFSSRRSELYQSLGENPDSQSFPTFQGADDVLVSALAVTDLGDALTQINLSIEHGAKLITLPELFWQKDAPPDVLAMQSTGVVDAIKQSCPTDVYIALSIIVNTEQGYQHQGIIINDDRVVLRQAQVHGSNRLAYSPLASEFEVLDSPYGKLALILEDDAIYPESFRLIAMQGAQVVFAPINLQEAWQANTGIIERASENRVNIIAASPKPQDCLICSLQKDFTIMTPWQDRQFDGLLSQCNVHTSPLVPLLATIYPRAAENKIVSHQTHLINSRPWQLMSAMLSPKTEQR